MPMQSIAEQLIHSHSLISDQVNTHQVRTILDELESVIRHGTPGAVVEFGCYVGTTSLFIRRLMDALGETATGRPFHVYDSFMGLPDKCSQDASVTGEQFVAGELAVTKKQFRASFQRARLTTPVIHKGWFAELTDGDVPGEIAFAFLDGDFYSSISDSLRLVVPHLQPGSVLVVDDYAREALPGVARAVHEVFAPQRVRTAYNLGIITFYEGKGSPFPVLAAE